jgi:RNA-directed DNA polymerase
MYSLSGGRRLARQRASSDPTPAKPSNKSGRPPAETGEGRTLTKENVGQPNPNWTPSQGSGPSGLDRVREAAKRDGRLRFTALLHQVTIERLRHSYSNLKKKRLRREWTG